MEQIFVECFGSLKDPRVERTEKHLLIDIVALALCGVISGAQSWEEVEDFGNIHKEWFSNFLEFPSACKKALHVINAWSCANGVSLG